MRWVRVHNLPDYAYFDHRPHMRAGVGCASCHGRIDQMEVVAQVAAAQHELVPRLPPQPRAPPAARARGDQHGVERRPRTSSSSRRGSKPRSGSRRRSTARGATGERAALLRRGMRLRRRRQRCGHAAAPRARVLAQPRAARRHAGGARLPRARVPGGGLGAARGHRPPLARAAAGRVAVARRARRLPPAGREHRAVRHAARGGRPGVPQRYATTMPFGSAATACVVESHEGRPTKIEGNELHPATRGSASAQMQAAILGLYDPDRSQHVLARAAAERRQRPARTTTHPTASSKRLGRLRRRLEGARGRVRWRPAAPGWRSSPPPSSSPTLFRLAAALAAALPAGALGDLGAGQRRERARRRRARSPAAPLRAVATTSPRRG